MQFPSDIPVEDIAHRLKKAIKKLTTHQVEALIEVIDAIVRETKKESRAQALDDVRVGLSAIGIFDGNVFDVIDRLKEKHE